MNQDNQQDQAPQQELPLPFLMIMDDDSPETVARKAATACFQHKTIVDGRTPDALKPWNSGGTRNPYGSTKKFNHSRAKLAWVSVYEDEDGKLKAVTRYEGNNQLKRTARELATKHDMSYGQAKGLLKHYMNERKESEDE